tara:strand:+ start:47 stop:385 length:339 start_codon:yes stop_codon:yes gene_type:complete
MTKSYEYCSRQGMLTGVKVTTVETIKTNTIPGERRWFDADFLELLLMLDDVWRTPRELVKYSEPLRLMDSSKISQVLKGLESQGLIESKKEGRKHTQWRRSHRFPKHAGFKS